MFRITAQNLPHGLVLKLEGRLAGAWVGEADACWRAVVATQPAESIVVDLCEVSALDDAGRTLILRMHRAGTGFKVRGCAMREIVREIVDADADTVGVKGRRQA